MGAAVDGVRSRLQVRIRPVATLHRRQASATVGEGETENCIQLLGWVESSVKVAPRVDDKEVL